MKTQTLKTYFSRHNLVIKINLKNLFVHLMSRIRIKNVQTYCIVIINFYFVNYLI